jgi:hypothetical protein
LIDYYDTMILQFEKKFIEIGGKMKHEAKYQLDGTD